MKWPQLKLETPGPKLPHFWQVVYEQSVLGEDLIFDGYQAAELSLDDKYNNQAERALWQIINAPTLSVARRLAFNLEEEIKPLVYFSYQNLMRAWGQHYKNQLN